jgi:hypothetical protein
MQAMHEAAQSISLASTRSPSRTASWVAKPPTAPLAPVTSRVAPGGAAIMSSAWRAVSALSGRVAAVASSSSVESGASQPGSMAAAWA